MRKKYKSGYLNFVFYKNMFHVILGIKMDLNAH